MKVLLDTCVLSEMMTRAPSPVVKSFVDGLDRRRIYISAVTVGEITRGICLLAAGKRKTDLEIWLQGLETGFEDRLLPITAEIARLWGEIMADAKKRGVSIPTMDGLIAATAIHHGLHLVTRNTADFEASGVLLINPWEAV